MIVGFTGTETGVTARQLEIVRNILINVRPTEFHHGDCIGADYRAHIIACSLDIPVVIHPPENSAKRANCHLREYQKYNVVVLPTRPYLVRNRDIVAAADLLIAAPAEAKEQLRSATWATIRYARKKGIAQFIIFSDGSIALDDPTRLQDAVMAKLLRDAKINLHPVVTLRRALNAR